MDKHHARHHLFILAFTATLLSLTGCAPHRLYHDEPHEYLQHLDIPHAATTADLAIIEFDDHGTFWDINQLNDTLDLIRQRNEEAERGVLVLVYTHGWKNNADPEQTDGDLTRFRAQLHRIAAEPGFQQPDNPDHLIGVYLGWRGATSLIPLHEQLTFWDRKHTAERLASYAMRETLISLVRTTKERPASKCIVSGHSMGGLIVGKTLGPALNTLMLASDDQGTQMLVDLVLLQNPALDALSTWELVEFLKRSNTTVELRTPSGESMPAPGPFIVSITSETDSATGVSYPLGQFVGNWNRAFRHDHTPPQPSQRYLATHAEGHVDYLVSHRARVENGEVVLEPVPGAYNDTPFWIIQVTPDISKDHGDIRNPRFGELVRKIYRLNRLYETDIQTWVFRNPGTPDPVSHR
ncbi:MAG: hypothetical protein AAGI30_14250 [Planctomycetota bacterium]